MISWAWVRRSIGKTRANRSGSRSQPQTICGVSEEVAQVSMTSGSADEAARQAALVLGRTRRARRDDGSTGSSVLGRRAAGGRSRARRRRPAGTRPGTARRRTAAGEISQSPLRPADPVVVAVPHVRRAPRRARSPRASSVVAQVGVAAAVADVPLPAWRRSPAACRPSRRSSPSAGSASARRRRSPDSRAARRPSPRGREKVVLPASSCVRRGARPSASQSGVSRRIRPSRPMTDPGRQLQLAPPRARRSGRRTCSTSRCPAPLSGSAAGWASTGISTPNSGERDRRAEQRLVALVVGVGDQRHAGRDQLGPGGLDVAPGRPARVERHPVVGAGVVAGLQLGLGDRGLERHVPQRRAPRTGTPRRARGCAGTPAGTTARARRSIVV